MHSRRNPPPKRKRRSTVTIPDHVGPHVRLVFAEMNRRQFTYDQVEEKSGVKRVALKAWRSKNRPSLESLEAVLGFLGYDFCPVPRAEVLPAAARAELQAVAERLELEMPVAIAALGAIVAGIHERFEPSAKAA